jgi:hypothetical protein
MNNFLQFYGQNEISPVSQNISDLNLHFGRRISLYRTLGLAASVFEGRSILEVAPGSGHNSIVTATLKPSRYDLVEPNPSGYKNMVSLFSEHHLRASSVRMFNSKLEDFQGEAAYDIVICEGLIPGLSEQDEFLQLLIKRVRAGGILVVTCADAVSVFFESLRRYLAKLLTRDLLDDATVRSWQKQAVDRLLPVFQSHLEALQGMSRPPKDWVWDNLLNPAAANLAATNEFSVEKCLTSLQEDFYFYGSNPVFMENWHWYKNIPLDARTYNKAYLDSYISQRHNFLHYQETCTSSAEIGGLLHQVCRNFSLNLEGRSARAWREIDSAAIQHDLDDVRQVEDISRRCGLPKAAAALQEFIALFDQGRIPEGQMIAEMTHFRGAFGRGQQYLSLIRV